MRKRIICILIIFLVVAVPMTGCTKSGEPSPTLEPIPAITLSQSPTPTSEAPIGKNKMKLAIGQKRSYTFTKDGENFGESWYEVSQKTQDGSTTYTIALGLDMTSSCVKSPPTTCSATLLIDQYANPISYTSDATIGSG